MREYQRKRKRQDTRSKVTGVVLTALVHVAALCLVSFTGLSYIYPPPEETAFVLDFSQEDEVLPKPRYGSEPRGEDVDREKDVNLVQKSESPYEGTAQNLTPAAKPDAHGDVEVPEPEREEEPKLDPRAAFPGMARKDTTLTSPHAAREASDAFKAGQAGGNMEAARTDGVANAHLEGRKVNKSTLVKPAYDLQESGRVVVKIWVDNYGNVKRAEAGADGTTVSNAKLWAAARSVAMKAHFDQKIDAPAMQEGTITYIFTLK